MADRVRVSDLDFVYISFKEPNKEENWANLKNKVPWAKRVDGVVGFDNAHKAAADVAETDFFISVDGDNIIDERSSCWRPWIGPRRTGKRYTGGGPRTASTVLCMATVVSWGGTSRPASL